MPFKDLEDNPNFISSIHSYCDRWCERCQFTARCAVYAAEEADPDIDPASRDINNAAFWQKLSSIFKDDEDDYLAGEDPRGSDGSAKAALIAIDRSTSAWKLMCDLRPKNADIIHKLVFQLEKLRSGAEREFPNARDFICPGFDEPTLDVLH